jgi:predicted Fe-Mo cluster-binding NifX family protein
MNVCIPVTQDKGLQSAVNPHFGSSPSFVIVDTDSGACRTVRNLDLHHSPGMCQPLSQLSGERLDALIVGGIGMGALAKLRNANIRVFLSDQPTVEAVVAAYKAGTLREMTPADTCAHHAHACGGSADGGAHGTCG